MRSNGAMWVFVTIMLITALFIFGFGLILDSTMIESFNSLIHALQAASKIPA